MSSPDRLASAHQALGEFVIAFQWVENTYRQLGWFILEPERRSQLLPKQLRRKTNQDLINTVTDLFVGLTNRYAFPDGDELAESMLQLKDAFHSLRAYRNRLLHSTYIEFKAGGESYGYLRASPERSVDPETGEIIRDQEALSADRIHAKLREYAPPIWTLNLNYAQLRMWHPFDDFPPKA